MCFVSYSFFQELNIDVCDVESLLVQCILDKYVFHPHMF